MNTTQISHARQTQIGMAFRDGRKAAAKTKCEGSARKMNPFAIRGRMPERLATREGALWHAYVAGIDRELSAIKNAATMMRNARFLMRRAIELGRA